MKLDFIGALPKIGSFGDLEDLVLNSSPEVLKTIAGNATARKLLRKFVEKRAYKTYMEDPNYPRKVQEEKFLMAKATIRAVERGLENAKGKKIEEALYGRFLPALIKRRRQKKEAIERFKEKYGFYPPGFLTISPGKACNLKCIGCYANSSSATREKLDWETVDRIITEKTESWGSWFTVISGGEPLLWESQGKTIIDLAKKHPDNFFLFFTNGTLINKEMAEKLAEAGNMTPAISVEGFEKETDKRRGKGVHKRILQAMENLREVGVPFGISMTATRENWDIITSEELIEYYWDKGALYAWIFQLMPIGRASLDLVVTPEQRLEMFRRTMSLIRKGYFIVDFWNCGLISNGCISAGRATGDGYLYIEWNGNVTPCVFNPYAAANIKEIYQRNGHIDEVLLTPFFEDIRKWQRDYGLGKPPKEIGNWILPCPIRDHYADMRKLIEKDRAWPIDEMAEKALKDENYYQAMVKYDEELAKVLDPVWEREYLAS